MLNIDLKKRGETIDKIKYRKLILSDTEFTITKTDSYPVLGKETKTTSHYLNKLKNYLEHNRVFYLDFHESDRYFIPLKVFANRNEINEFKELLESNKN